MTNHFFWLVFLGYFLSLTFYFVQFESAKPIWARVAGFILLLSLALHIFFIANIFVNSQACLRTFPEYVYIVSFFAVSLPLYAEYRFKAKHVLLFSLPLVLFFCLLAMSIGQKGALTEQPKAWLLWVHLGFIFGGMGALVSAASGAVMYLLQSAQLKSKKPGILLLKLPSLETLDRLHFRTLVWGVILFSMGILSGFFWAKNIPNLRNIFLDPKVIISFLACPLYWGILSLRFSPLRRGKRIALSTVFVFFVFFALLVATYYCPTGFHNKGL